MPVATVSLPDGSTADIEYQEGATDDQILDFAFGEYQKSLEIPSQNLFSDSLFRQGIVQEDAVEEEEEEELGFFEGVGDVLTNIATGATTGTKAITSGLVGVDNAISDSLNDTQDYLQSYLSAQAKADQQEMGRIQQEAEDKGVWDQVKAAGEAVSKAPLDVTAQAAGTVVPQLGAAAVAFGVGSAVGTPLLGAAAAGLTNRAVAGVQGVGYIRESIYNAVYSEYKQADYPEEVAKQKALEAQELSGDNWYQLLAGGVIGVVAGGSGLEKAILNKVLGDKAAQKLSQNALVRFGKGAISEAIPEGLQGAHEALAANTALQNENFDTPTFRGVPFQGAMEFAVGAPLGGFAGALNSPEQSSGDMFYDREEALTEQAIEKEAQLRAQEQKELEEENQKLFDALVANGVSEEEALAEIRDPILQWNALLPPPESFDEREGIVTLSTRTIKDPETARLDAQNRDKKERKFGATNAEKQRIKFAKEAAQQIDVPAGDRFTSIDEKGLDENGVPQYTGNVFNRKGEIVQSFDDPVVAAFAARELNNKVIQKTADFHVNSAVEQSEQDLTNAEKSVLRRIGRRLLNPNENTFSIDQVNYAANTTRESGFETEGLSAAEALDRGIPEDQMTASQKINAKRIKKGMPVLSSFSVKETKEALGDLFPRLVDLDVNYDGATYKAEIVDGKPVVVSDLGDVIKTRRTNPRQFGRRSPEASNRVNFASIAEAKQYADSLNYTAQQRGSVFVGDELFGANEIAPDDIRRLLKEKNISSEIGSPEVRFIASIATGDTRTRISDMSGVDLRLVYNKLRAMPNFKKPTKIPLYKPKSYSPAQYEFAANMLIEEGVLPDIKIMSDEVSDITKADYKRLLKDLQKDVGVKSRLEGATAARETTEAAEKEQQERQRTQEEERSRIQGALNKALKGFGLERLKANVVDTVSSVTEDSNGNLVFGSPRENAEVIQGEYIPAMNRIFIASDAIKNSPEYTGDNLEQMAVSVLNHEILHAMRQLDLITQREYQLLENLAVNQIIPEGREGAGMTFFQFANQRYGNDLSEIAVMEEAVAELVRSGLDGDLKIGGKPKALMKRIVEFIKGMFGVKEDLGYETFDDLIRGITGGQIGARADNEIRSLRATEMRRAESFARDPETGEKKYEEDDQGKIIQPEKLVYKEPEFPDVYRGIVEGRSAIQPTQKQAEADFLVEEPEDVRLDIEKTESDMEQLDSGADVDVEVEPASKQVRRYYMPNPEDPEVFKKYKEAYRLIDFGNIHFQQRMNERGISYEDILEAVALNEAKIDPKARTADSGDLIFVGKRAVVAIARGRMDGKEGFSAKTVIPSKTKDKYESFSAKPRSQKASDVVSEQKTKSQRTHSKEQVQKSVEENAKQAIDSKGIAVPTYSLNASPEAQYVARNPEAGDVDQTTMNSLTKRPESSAEEKDLLERLTGEAPAPRSQFDVYNESVNNISSNSDTSKFKFFSDQFRQQFIDRFSRIGRITRENKDVLSQLASSSSYKALLNADRSMGLVEGGIKHGHLVYMDGIGQIDRSKKSLIETLAPLQNTKYGNIEREFKAYAVAMRGYNLNLKGIKTPVSEGDKEKAIAMAKKYTDENGQSIIENVYKDWQDFNGSTVKFLQDTGVIDDEAAQTWLENADYYPFYTEVAVGQPKSIFEKGPDNKEIAQNVFSGMTRAATFTKLEGSENSINLDSSVAISRNLMAAVQMGLNNVAQQRVARDMMKIGLAEEVSTQVNLQPSAIEIRVNGKKRRFLIKDPLVYESLTAMDGIEGGFWYKLINLPSQVLRETVTRSPDFVLANLMRDSLSSYITTGAGRKVFPLYSTFKEFAAGDIEELQRFGLVQGYDLSRQASDIGKFFAKESAKREQGIMSQLKNPFKATWDVLGGMTTKSDAATRLAVYKDVLARTGDHAEAAFQAMEVLNFGRRGRNLTFRYFAAAVPFLNARIQGLDVLYRAMMGYQSADLSKSRGQIAATALTRTGILTGITFLYWLAMHDEDEYKAEDDVVRELNFLIKTPFGFTMKMPTAFEVGFITKIIPEAIFNANAKAINEALGRDTDGKMADYTDKQMFDTLVRGFGTATQLSPFDIQITGPFLEAAANYNSFTKRPIVPPYIMEGSGGGARFPSEQYTPYTSETGKVIGKLTDTSPMIVDHMIRGYTGTIGTYLSAAVDGIVRMASDPKGAAPTVPITEMPLMRRFFAREAPGGLKSEVYELSNELSMAIGALEDMQEAGRSEEAKAFIAERRTLFDKEKDIKNLRKRVDKARKEIKEIVASDLDREEKRKRKQEIENYINEYLMGAVPEIYASVKTPITRVGGI